MTSVDKSISATNISSFQVANKIGVGEERDFFDSLLGWDTVLRLEWNSRVLFACRTVRLFSFGFLAVILFVYLVSLGFSTENAGSLLTWTLLGDAGISLFITSHADVFGRKRMLIISSLISIFTGLIFATQSNYWLLLITGILGVLSPSGNDCGPFLAIELAALSQMCSNEDRTRVMAWYNLVGSFATAFGSLFCGIYVSWLQNSGYTALGSYQSALVLYALLQIGLVVGFHFLNDQIEIPEADATVKKVNPISLFLGLHKSKYVVLTLSCLFIIDSFAGSFVLQTLVSDWFELVYSTPADLLGTIFFFCNIFAGISALFAAKIADIIGLVNTMVFTHLPSNVLLILVPLMPNEICAILMLIARFSISQMDVPARNAYVVSVVSVDERSAAGGVTNMSRSIGAALGPSMAGILLTYPAYWNYPFYIAGGLKIIYDLLLLVGFQSVKPKDEIEKEKMKEKQSLLISSGAPPVGMQKTVVNI